MGCETPRARVSDIPASSSPVAGVTTGNDSGLRCRDVDGAAAHEQALRDLLNLGLPIAPLAIGRSASANHGDSFVVGPSEASSASNSGSTALAPTVDPVVAEANQDLQ